MAILHARLHHFSCFTNLWTILHHCRFLKIIFVHAAKCLFPSSLFNIQLSLILSLHSSSPYLDLNFISLSIPVSFLFSLSFLLFVNIKNLRFFIFFFLSFPISLFHLPLIYLSFFKSFSVFLQQSCHFISIRHHHIHSFVCQTGLLVFLFLTIISSLLFL